MGNNQKNFTDRVWDAICSLKLTIILLLLLALTSIIGTVLQQNAPAAEYIQEYGRSNYELFKALQFTNMYSSTWFIGILALFSVNLVCCSIKNLPRAWKFVQDPAVIPSAGLLKGAANRGELKARGEFRQVAEKVSGVLKKEIGRTTLTEQDGKLYLFAQKGIYSRFGAYITHLSILIIMAGAIIGNIWGYKAFVNIPEGSSVSEVRSRTTGAMIPLDFTVRCDDFTVSFYPNSQRPKDYTSDLVVLEQGQEILRKTIEVNDPLTYKGITFYQASYGQAGNPSFTIRATDNATGKVIEVTTGQGEHVELMNGYSFALTGFTPNDRNFGPAMQLHVDTPDGRHGNPFVVWQNYPQFDVKRAGTFSFALLDYNTPQFTGLQVTKDPGVNVVWLGCFLLIAGSLSAFFVSHKRVWASLEQSGNRVNITIIGNAHRNQPGFSLAFDELLQKIETGVNNKSQQKEG